MLEVVKNHDTAEPVAFHPVINPQFWKPSDKDALYYTLDSVDDFRRMQKTMVNPSTNNRVLITTLLPTLSSSDFPFIASSETPEMYER